MLSISKLTDEIYYGKDQMANGESNSIHNRSGRLCPQDVSRCRHECPYDSGNHNREENDCCLTELKLLAEIRICRLFLIRQLTIVGLPHTFCDFHFREDCRKGRFFW